MKLHDYLIEAFDDTDGYCQQVVRAISVQDAEREFEEINARLGKHYEVVEITLIRL